MTYNENYFFSKTRLEINEEKIDAQKREIKQIFYCESSSLNTLRYNL